MLSFTEENYVKGIYALTRNHDKGASTNEIAHFMKTKASSVTDMVKKLSKKKLINYVPYQGVTLTEEGRLTAVKVLRKHRLWEVFLVDKLGFKWDEVHEIAEELEHIQSDKLIEKLDMFLGYPKQDPHGDPIPDKDGNMLDLRDTTIADLTKNQFGMIIGLKDTSPEFLKFLESAGLTLGKTIGIKDVVDYDNSMVISVNMTHERTISHMIAKNLYVKKLSR